MKIHRKRKAKGFGKMSIIYISIIALLNMVGVGYGFWSNSVEIKAMVSTGEIKASFGKTVVVFENSDKKVAWASGNGGRMYIGMQNAFPGYSAVINYEVKNEGTIPIKCDAPEVEIEQTGNILPVSIEVTPPEGTIRGYGEKKVGTIIVRVEEENYNPYKSVQNMYGIKQKKTSKIKPLNIPIVENCGFSMKLVYHQDTRQN